MEERTVRLPLAEIVVGRRLRPLNAGRVAKLAESLERLGQINSITVSEEMRLLAGRHRHEAAERIGWKDIEAKVIDISARVSEVMARVPDMDPDHARELVEELYEIEENLNREELTVLEEGEHLVWRSEVLGELGLRAQRGGTGANQHQEQTDQPDRSALSTTADLASERGKSAGTARRRMRIAKCVSEAARDRLRPTEHADNQAGLLKLAGLTIASGDIEVPDEDAQAEVIDDLFSDDPGSSATLSEAVRARAIRKRIEEVRSRLEVSDDAPARVVCGSAPEVLAAMDDASAHLCVTDPPYGLDVHRTRGGGQDYADGREYAFKLLDQVCAELTRVLTPDAHLYVFSGYSYVQDFKEILARYFDVQDNPALSERLPLEKKAST